KRRSQLVRGVRDELAARVIETREPGPHALERPRELAELVAATIRNLLVEVAARDSIRGPLEPANASSEKPRSAVADRQRYEQREPTGEEQPSLEGPDVGQCVVQRRGQKEHLAPFWHRDRDLRELAVAPRNRSALELRRPG